MAVHSIFPDAVVTDSGTVQQFPVSGTKIDKIIDTDDNTYVYVQYAATVSNWELGFGTYTMAGTERCAGARIRNRKTQNYMGSSLLTSKLYQTSTYLSGADEATAGTFLDQDLTGAWRMTELAQADIDALRTRNAFAATSANVLLKRQSIELDIRTKPIPTPNNSQDATGIDPANFSVGWSANAHGSTQTKYEVKLFTEAVATAGGFDPATSTPCAQDSGEVASGSATYTYAGTPNLAYGTRYYAYVRMAVNFNGTDWWSDYTSSPWRFTTNAAPVTTVTAPSGTITSTSTPAVSWTYSDADGESQERYEVRIYAQPGGTWAGFDPDTTAVVPTWETGSVLSDAGTVTPSVIPNSVTYRAYVRTQQHGMYSGLPVIWSAWAYSDFVMNLTQPNAPTLTLTDMNSDTDRVAITLTPPGSTPVAIAYYILQKSVDGGTTWATFRVNDPPVTTDNITSTGSPINFTDYEALLNRDIKYRAFSVSTTLGTPVASAPSSIATTHLNHNKVWIKNVSDPGQNYSVPVEDTWLDVKRRRVRTVYEPRGRQKPVVVRGEARHDAFDIQFLALNAAGQAAIELLLDSDTTLFVQTPKRSWYAEVRDDAEISDSLWDHKRNREDVARYVIPFQEVDVP